MTALGSSDGSTDRVRGLPPPGRAQRKPRWICEPVEHSERSGPGLTSENRAGDFSSEEMHVHSHQSHGIKGLVWESEVRKDLGGLAGRETAESR